MPTLALQSRCRIASLKLQHERRHAGETNCNHLRLTRLWLNIFTSFSIISLRLATLLRLAMASIGAASLIALVVQALIDRHALAG